jgi:hypothetical protein
MGTLEAALADQMKNPEFRAEWDALESGPAIAQAMINARKNSGPAQKQIPERPGIAQGDISKLENAAAILR